MPDAPTLQRRPAAEVIDGLPTTSEKIRALARAGYLRTEIRDVLGIRYQHVRKVLVDAGIDEGLHREVQFERSPITTTVAPGRPVPTLGSALLQSGFRAIGEWVLAEGGTFVLNGTITNEPGVYAFVVDGVVRYIGVTQRGFRTRMDHYRRGHVRQRTSARVKKLIAAALSEGRRVEVLVATPEGQTWNGWPVDTTAGLEAGLIRKIRPEWNMMGMG